VNAEQSSSKDEARGDPSTHSGMAGTALEVSEEHTQLPCRGSGDGMYTRGERAQHGKPVSVVGRDDQLRTGDGWRGRYGVVERPVLLRRPGNAGGGKGPLARRVLRGYGNCFFSVGPLH
jgi:hypothetical protein